MCDEGRAEVVADEMLHDRHADLAREREHVGIEVGRQGKRQRLILGAKISPLQPLDVLRILRRRAGAAVIGEHCADTGVL